MTCTNCRSDVRSGAKFCPTCGTSIPVVEVSTPKRQKCAVNGCTETVAKEGHQYCYKHWKAIQQPTDTNQPLTASLIGQHFSLSSSEVNRILAELGWITQAKHGWAITETGRAHGGEQRRHAQTQVRFAVWPPSLLENRRFSSTVRSIKGDDAQPSPVGSDSAASFRDKFPAQHRTTDGHWVRSKAEVLIDNWLYIAGITHAYERLLPIEEDVYCDFYLPTGKVYIEYWGIENDERYAQRKREKQHIYKKYAFQLIELEDAHIRNLDDYLPKLLLPFGITVL